ncbi:MAG: hypothetical protein GY774_19000 [Planctomycetes bacterium]|nr:hypothetical protein [Planctomycetota bacterium]
MSESEKKWKNRLILVRGIILGCALLLFVIGNYYGSYARIKESECFVAHEYILMAIKKRLNSGDGVPATLSEQSVMNSFDDPEQNLLATVRHQTQRRSLEYYADAWGKPGRVLLRSSVCGSYAVTFGDGSRAVLSFWNEEPTEADPNEAKAIEKGLYFHAPGPWSPTSGILVLLVLALCFFAILIIERRERNK